MLPNLSGIFLAIERIDRFRRFLITKEKRGRPTLYWDGHCFSPDRAHALVFDDFNAARDKAWELRGDFCWIWLDNCFSNN